MRSGTWYAMAPVRCRSTRHYPAHEAHKEEYRKFKWPFPTTTALPRARVGPDTPRQRLASAKCRRQATGPPARMGPGDGEAARLELHGRGSLIQSEARELLKKGRP